MSDPREIVPVPFGRLRGGDLLGLRHALVGRGPFQRGVSPRGPAPWGVCRGGPAGRMHKAQLVLSSRRSGCRRGEVSRLDGALRMAPR